MTKEEAIKEMIRAYDVLDFSCHMDNRRKEAFNMAKEALEQEPCEDAIPRSTAIQLVNDVQNNCGFSDYEYYEYLYDHLSTLPSVNPKVPKYCDRNICIKNEYNGIGCDECEVTKSQEPKTGHWIRQTDDYHDYYECEHCGIAVGLDDIKNYCPNCGAKMEGEDKE